MLTSPSNPTQPADPLPRDEAEALAAKLVAEMIERWRQGERPPVEEFLARSPELWQHPAAAADLIYEELCLRQEYGPELPVEEMLRRFPQWRAQLEVLFDCQRILGPRRSQPHFPALGEFLGDFFLLAELGSGAHGRVFLASQVSLGHRPVVLKVTATEFLPVGEAHEHLALARLQHTHIVPLYSVQDYPGRGLRALCMPYFGGATLSQLLHALRSRPPGQRTGQSLLDALDQIQAATRVTPTPSVASPLARREGSVPASPTRRALAAASYEQAVCWIGACLADALQYAHERGLVHLDLKPSNVLLAADGQPMLLDFHLAREPLHPGEREALWLGGTLGYMSPEQQAAVQAINRGRTVERPVDGRSDIYALGLVLHEALGDNGRPALLRAGNPQVSPGLADIIHKCLAEDPSDRYPQMAALAVDLRRQLAHLPLLGIRNRSLAERWRKWRRRRPHGVALLCLILALLTAGSTGTLGAVRWLRQRIPEVRRALEEGKHEMERGAWEGAIKSFQYGLSVAQGMPFQQSLVAELDERLRRAEQKRTVQELHRLANQIRFLGGADPFPAGGMRGLEAYCRTFWDDRFRIVERLRPPGAATLEAVVRDDLLDLAMFWADLQGRLAPPDKKEDVRRTVLAEAEALFGTSPVLNEGQGSEDAAWRHYLHGRTFLRAGDLARAAQELEQAVRLQPQSLWANFYQGLCAYRRGRYAEALTAYSVCIGAAPEPPGCFYNRAVVFEALGQLEQARQDYDQALALDPTLGVAYLNRGMLQYRGQRYAAARADLQQARELGADPATVCFDLALVNLASGDRATALDNLCQALRWNPQQAEARKLQEELRRQESAPAPAGRSR